MSAAGSEPLELELHSQLQEVYLHLVQECIQVLCKEHHHLIHRGIIITKDHKQRGIYGFIVCSPLFLFFIFSFYNNVIQYFLEETSFTEGRLKKSVSSLIDTSFHYNYSVDSVNYEGRTTLSFKYNLKNEIFTVRYLINNPSKSVIDDYIFREMFIDGIFTGGALLLQVYWILLYLGVKSKWIY